MPNTFKKLTFIYIAAALLLPPFVWSLGLNVSMIHIGAITVPVFGFLSYRSFRKATAADSGSAATPVAVIPSTGRGPTQTQMIVILSVIALILLGYKVRGSHLLLEGIFTPALEGAYRDNRGGKVEFVANGNLIATTGTTTTMARWSRVDNTRFRFEPAGIGLLAQVCEYRFDSYAALSITGCDFRMDLSRM